MKRGAHGIYLVTLLLNLILFCGPRFSEAAPNLINYQGELADSGGTPVPDGSYTMIFRIFDAAVAGTPLWEESQSVATANGIYNVLLGSGTINPSYGAFDATLFSADNR